MKQLACVSLFDGSRILQNLTRIFIPKLNTFAAFKEKRKKKINLFNWSLARTRTRTILYYMWYSVYHSVHRLSFNEIYGVNISLMIFKMIYGPYSELNRYIWSPLRLQDHDSSEAKDWMVRSWTGYFEVFICLKNLFAKMIF